MGLGSRGNVEAAQKIMAIMKQGRLSISSLAQAIDRKTDDE